MPSYIDDEDLDSLLYGDASPSADGGNVNYVEDRPIAEPETYEPTPEAPMKAPGIMSGSDGYGRSPMVQSYIDRLARGPQQDKKLEDAQGGARMAKLFSAKTTSPVLRNLYSAYGLDNLVTKDEPEVDPDGVVNDYIARKADAQKQMDSDLGNINKIDSMQSGFESRKANQDKASEDANYSRGKDERTEALKRDALEERKRHDIAEEKRLANGGLGGTWQEKRGLNGEVYEFNRITGETRYPDGRQRTTPMNESSPFDTKPSPAPAPRPRTGPSSGEDRIPAQGSPAGRAYQSELDKLRKAIDTTAGARAGLAGLRQRKESAERIEATALDKNGGVKNLTPEQFQMLQTETAALIGQGHPAASSVDHLVARTSGGDWAKFKQYITTNPQPADLQEFTKLTLALSKTEKDLIDKQTDRAITSKLGGFYNFSKQYPKTFWNAVGGQSSNAKSMVDENLAPKSREVLQGAGLPEGKMRIRNKSTGKTAIGPKGSAPEGWEIVDG